MNGVRSAKWRGWLGVAAIAAFTGATIALTGCGNFFVCTKASCTTSGSGTTNYAYVSNSTTGSTYLNGYALATGALVAATGFPYSLGYTPSAMVVSQNNNYLYVGSNTSLTSGTASLHVYSIGTGGALGSGSTLFTAQVAALAVSADGKWLFVLNTNDGLLPTTITDYQMNTDGTLTQVSSQAYSGGTGVLTPNSIKVAPSGNYLAVAAGTAGALTFPFNTSTGAIGSSGTLITFSSASVGANDLGIDSNNYLYLATTTGVVVFAIPSTGVLAKGSTSVSSLTTGSNALTSLAVDGTSHIYAGNPGSAALYGFSTTSAGVVTALSPASLTGPASLSRLAVDSSGKYLLALGFASGTGLEMFSIGSGGALTLTSPAVSTDTSGSSPALLALTH